MSQGNPLFPVFLKLDQLTTLVVGGGNVALEKLEGLLKNDARARIHLIAPEIHDSIRTLARELPNIRLSQRRFGLSDLDRIDLLILATDDHELHGQIKRHAKVRRILTNVADTPELCDFYLGSTVKRGDLKIGISTNGKSPTFAKRFRQVLEEVLPEETDQLLQNLHGIRNRLKGDFSFKVKELNSITKKLIS